MNMIIRVVAFLLLLGGTAAACQPSPPAQAVAAGFTQFLFNSDFNEAPSLLAKDLSCAGTPQVNTWKQGQWWEGQGGAAGEPPCSQISIVNDLVFGHNVLDLSWTPANKNTTHGTTISTF